MDDALFIHRIHFAFTITYHYIFPQLTIGLAPLIVILKTLGLRTNNPAYDDAARIVARHPASAHACDHKVTTDREDLGCAPFFWRRDMITRNRALRCNG